MRFLIVIGLILWTTLFGLPVWASGDLRPGCDSCRFEINSLDRPFSTIGTWLFTREDDHRNKDVEWDTAGWKLVKTPGPWKNVYADGTYFRVGWYRGVFKFSPSLIGQDVVFMFDPYMARANVFIDGVEVFRRPGDINMDRYYSIQPIPIRFKVSKEEHVIAIRVDTWLMTGIYQLPFEVKKYDPHDLKSVMFQFQGAEFRLIAASVAFSFGLFFLLIYGKTRYGLYLCASLTGLVIAPFFVAPTDYLLRIFPPEPLFFLHYPGLIFGYFIFLSSQYFHKFTPKINWVAGILFASTSLVIASMMIFPNLDLFQKVRPLHLVFLLLSALASGYMFINGVKNKKPGARILLAGMFIFLATGINDFLLAAGRINSIGTMVLGIIAFTSALLFVASNIFANTFRENKRLVISLSSLNENLEELVADRTRELAVAVEGLGVANKNLSTSYEQLKVAKDELVRSEKLAGLGSLVAGIAHELNTPLGNGLMATSTLREQMQNLKEEMATKGPRRSTLDSFMETVETATDITMRSLNRSASLVTSFKQIAVDQTSSNRGKFKLPDLIKDVLMVLQPTLKATPFKVESFVTENIELDSFPGPLGQILTNLINNAIVHAFDGKVSGIIQIRADFTDTNRVIILVKDDGQGISAENLPKIFDPFFTTKLGQGGSGLGLHIVHNIVTQILGGTLKVTTQVGVGSEFMVDIPRVAPMSAKHLNA